MKKFISLFFVLCFVFCFSVPVYADTTEEKQILDSGQCGESLYWELDSEGLLRIFGTGPMYDYNKYYEPSPWYKYRDEPYISEDGEKILDSNGDPYLSTESYYANNPNGYKIKDILIEEGITYIGDWAFYRVCVDEITVPEGVEATGIFCFRYSPTLKVLNLPDSLKVLDDYAISRNYELEVVNIGNSLETIGTAGFNHNPSLKRIVLPDTCTTINKQLSPAYAAIDYSKVGLMENCSSLEYVYFGNVTDIPQRTCLGASLKSVVIPNTVKKIDTYAFYACESLEDVIFEDGSVCTEINSTAFSGCTSLKRVKGGTALEKLGLYTSVVSLEEFDFSGTNNQLSARQFLGTSLKEVTVSDKITTIPVACFNSMKSLEKIYLPGTLTEIMASSFNYCESLKDIYFDGTQTQWWSVKKASGWSYKVNSECMVHFSDGTSLSISYTPKKYTVTFLDYDGTVISTQQVIVGLSATAPQAPSRKGYEFTGWDKEFTNITENTVVTAEYAELPKPIALGKLQVDVAGGTGFKVSVNGGNLRPQGSIYVNTKLPIGAEVTVVANDTSGADFLGWMNEFGLIVSSADTYTFKASGNDYLKAAYKTDIEGVNSVIFKNSKASGGNGHILDMQYYAAGDEIIFPDTPYQAGFDFTGWDMTAEDIQAKLSAGEDVTVLAKWERAKVYVSVVANNGTISTAAQPGGKYLAYGAVTVVANAAAEGQKFAYWTDAEGRIVSYDAEYKFFPAQNTELTAVYVESSETVVKKPLVFISGDPSDMGQEAINYSFAWDIDASIGTVTSAGLMWINQADYKAETFYHGSGDSKLFDRAFGANQIKNKNNTYAINKTESLYGNTYVACLFVVYTDAKTGDNITIYSDSLIITKPSL